MSPECRVARWTAAVLITVGLALAAGVGTASADTGGYPYASVPCVYSPHATTGSGYWCSGYNWGTIRDNASSASELSPYGYDYRNCTDYVAWKLASLGVQPAQYTGLGNANTWGARAGAHGVVSNGSPAVGSVAVSTAGSFGHIAFVTAANGSQITVSQYNQPQDGTYTTQTGTPASLGFSSFDHFEGYEGTGGAASGTAGPASSLAFTRSDGTFVRSGDGAPWQQIMTSPATDISVSATRVALVNSDGGFFRVNDGAPWTKVSTGIVGLSVGGA
jgi:surface antigen